MKRASDKPSPQLLYYRRNRERILAEMAAAYPEIAEKRKQYRAQNAEKVREQDRLRRVREKEKREAYFAQNRERINAAKRAKYAAQREERCAERRATYATDTRSAEANRKKMRERYAADPEARRVETRKWRSENPEKVRLLSAAKRARKAQVTGIVSKDIAAKLKVAQRGLCACCRERLTKFHVDHVMPLALGGLHDDSNLQLLCPGCNMSKHAKHPVDFMQSRGFLL